MADAWMPGMGPQSYWSGMQDDVVFDVLRLTKGGAEYKFWETFFEATNPRWLQAFKEATQGTGSASEFIYWDFIDGVDSGTGSEGQKKSYQYHQAMDVAARECGSGRLSKGTLGVLHKCANAVLDQRRNAPYRDVAHERVFQHWKSLVETIANALQS